MAKEDQQRVWRLYGWYTALMFCGSCFGVVAWASRIMFLVNRFEWTFNFQNLAVRYSLRALDLSWTAAFVVAYAFEFLFLSAALLMVLDRMSDAVPQQLGDVMRARLVVGGRIVMAVVVLGNAAGLSANVAAAIYFQKSSHDYNAASACYFSNNTNDGLEYVASGTSFFQRAIFVLSVQRLFEAAVLLLIVAAFAAVGIMCARRVSSALDGLHHSGLDMAAGMRIQQQFQQTVDVAVALGEEMRQEIIVTTSFVFVCFVLRSAAFPCRRRCCCCRRRCCRSCLCFAARDAEGFRWRSERHPVDRLIRSRRCNVLPCFGARSRAMHFNDARRRRNDMRKHVCCTAAVPLRGCGALQLL
jgi:hypothetical protein